MYRKNTSGQYVCFQGIDTATGGIKSGVSWTVRRSIDGTAAAGGGSVTEDGSTGWYSYAMSQADTNGNDIGFNFTGTGAVPQTVNIVTTACDPTAAANFGITDLDATISSRMATYTQPTGFLSATFPSGTVANTTNITAGTITTATTATNLTNAPTNGDFTAAMKTSLNAATVTLSAAGIQAIWDALTSALTTVGSIGKLLVTNIDAAISSRLASGSYTAPDNASITAIKAQTDKITFTVSNQVDSNVHYVNDVKVNGIGTAGSPWGP